MAVDTGLSQFVRESVLPGVVAQEVVLGPLFQDMKKNSIPIAGGSISKEIRHVGHNRTQGGGEFAEAPVVKRDIITRVTLTSKEIWEPIDISMSRVRRIKDNVNRSQMLSDYMSEMVAGARDSMSMHLAKSMFSNGATLTNPYGKPLPQLTGFKSILARDTSYAGISPTDAPTWNPNTVDYTGSGGSTTWHGITLTSGGSKAKFLDPDGDEYLPKLMSEIATACTFTDFSEPTFFQMGESIYNLFLQCLSPNQRFQQDTAYAGFKAVYLNSYPVFLNKNCGRTDVICVTTKHLHWGFNPGAEMTLDDFIRRAGSDVQTALLISDCEMLCSSRRTQGGILGITDPIPA